jgi:hypothetical protein
MKKESISGIKIIGGGLKGLEVSYSRLEKDKDGLDWLNNYWTDRSQPINFELKKLVEAFRFYLYDIYGYAIEDTNQAELEILEIKSDGNSFQIVGKQKVLDGTKYVPMKTPKILEEDGYGKYVEVIGLIGQLYAEVGEYMKGNREFNNAQFVIDFNKGTEFDVAEFNRMTATEQKVMATDILEKMGSIVIHNDEVEEDVIESVAAVLIEAPVFAVPVAEVKVKEVNFGDSEDEFSITPLKVARK